MIAIRKDELSKRVVANLYGLYAKDITTAHKREVYNALIQSICEIIGKSWSEYNNITHEGKTVYVFSFELMTGKFLPRNLLLMGAYDICHEVMKSLGYDLEEIIKEEKDMGLGYSTIGSVTADIHDSMATLGIKGFGYGLRYRKGMFGQDLGGELVLDDRFLSMSCQTSWEHKKSFYHDVRFNDFTVRAVAYDIPIVGQYNDIVNTVRLWSSEAVNPVEFTEFSKGDFEKAYREQLRAKSIVEFLYPDDSLVEGKKLRIIQEYFFASATIKDILRRFFKNTPKRDLRELSSEIAIHINDIHPSFTILELIRIAVDEHSLLLDEALKLTREIFTFMNFSVMGESMESWDLHILEDLIGGMFPLIRLIDDRLHVDLKKTSLDDTLIADLKIIKGGHVDMTNLVLYTCKNYTGLSLAHSVVLKDFELPHQASFYKAKFKTTQIGILHRHWLEGSNPSLYEYLSDLIGTREALVASDFRKLSRYYDNQTVLDDLYRIKSRDKQNLSSIIYDRYRIKVNPYSIYEMQLDNIHENRRQLLNALDIASVYFNLKDNANLDISPRTYFIAGKAAFGYYMAQEIVSLINALSKMINNDRHIKDKIKVVFLEDNNIGTTSLLIPSADISQQLATASKESAGTTMLKLMANGAVPVATQDGLMMDAEQTMNSRPLFTFGLSIKEVYDAHRTNSYQPSDYYKSNDEIKMVIDRLISLPWEVFPYDFNRIFNTIIRYNDSFLVLRDLPEYMKTQTLVTKAYMDKYAWQKLSLEAIALTGDYSMDETVKHLAKYLWENQ